MQLFLLSDPPGGVDQHVEVEVEVFDDIVGDGAGAPTMSM
jgi:hypothetical protein